MSSALAWPLRNLSMALLQEHVADPAGRAVAAALVHEEGQVVVDDLEDVARAGEHDHRAAGGEIVEAQPAVEAVAPDHRAAGAADLHRRRILGARQRQQARARSRHRAARRRPGARQSPETLNSLVPWLSFGADGGEPFGAPVEDARDMGTGLDVVHHGREAQIAALHREGRPGLRLAAAAPRRS